MKIFLPEFLILISTGFRVFKILKVFQKFLQLHNDTNINWGLILGTALFVQYDFFLFLLEHLMSQYLVVLMTTQDILWDDSIATYYFFYC